MTVLSYTLRVLIGFYSLAALWLIVSAFIHRGKPGNGCGTIIALMPLLLIIPTYIFAVRHMDRCSAEAAARERAGLPPIVRQGKARGWECP